MMRRTGFKRRSLPERAPMAPARPVRRVAPTVIGAAALAQPKEDVVRSEPYRRLVALFPCKICGIDGYSQAAHPNTGKGAGIKSDDRLCFPLCCDRPGVQGCHLRFDQHALYPRHVRRALEPSWAADTQRQIIAAGLWPKNLPIYQSN